MFLVPLLLATILIMPSAKLVRDKYHWFHSSRIRTHEVRIPRPTKTGAGRSTCVVCIVWQLVIKQCFGERRGVSFYSANSYYHGMDAAATSVLVATRRCQQHCLKAAVNRAILGAGTASSAVGDREPPSWAAFWLIAETFYPPPYSEFCLENGGLHKGPPFAIKRTTLIGWRGFSKWWPP